MFHRFPPHDQNSCRIVTKPRDDEESTSAQSAVQAKVPWRDDPTGRLTKSATAVRRGTEPKRWRAIGQSWPVGCIKDFTDHKTAWKFKEPLMGKCETMFFFVSFISWQIFDTRSRFFPWAQLLDRQIFSSVKVRRSTAVLQPWASHGWFMCRFGRCHSAQTFVQRSKRERGQMEKRPKYERSGVVLRTRPRI